MRGLVADGVREVTLLGQTVNAYGRDLTPATDLAALLAEVSAVEGIARIRFTSPFLGLTGLAALARVTPAQAREWLTEQFYLQRKSLTWEPWAVQQAASHDWRMMLEAGSAIGNFTSSSVDRADRRADLGRRHHARRRRPAATPGRAVRLDPRRRGVPRRR